MWTCSGRNAMKNGAVLLLSCAMVFPSSAEETGVREEGGQDACLMRFGVASDVHLLSGWRDGNCRDLDGQADYLEKALRWFDSQKADAVVFPGDMAHTGRIAELELFAAVWDRVFPDCRASDGRRVERLIVTGNHEIGQWNGLWDGYSDERLRRERFDYDLEHMRSTWRRLFHEEFELVWQREVKGVTFLGAQYSRLNPPIARFISERASKLDPAKPFFYIQHAHPAHTCYGEEASSAWSEMESFRVLAAFPNAVAISGHSHNSLADERSVWQGAFTSIGAGSLAEATPCYVTEYDNGLPPYNSAYGRQRMKCVPQIGNSGRSCLMVDVYADHLVVHRQSIQFDEPLGPDWVVPIPPSAERNFDFGRCVQSVPPPRFASDAKVSVSVDVNASENVGPGLVGNPCVLVSFPCAETVEGSRVFDYVVTFLSGNREILVRRVLSYGYYMPESRSCVRGECIVGQDELPKNESIRVVVKPRNCYGREGNSISGQFVLDVTGEDANAVISVEDAGRRLLDAVRNANLRGGRAAREERHVRRSRGISPQGR